MEAIKWSMANNKPVMESLFERAETIKAVIRQLEAGQSLQKEDMSKITSLKAEHVTGFTETERLKELARASEFLQEELDKKMQVALEAKNRAANSKDKKV